MLGSQFLKALEYLMNLKFRKMCRAVVASATVLLMFGLCIDKGTRNQLATGEIERVTVPLEEQQHGATPTEQNHVRAGKLGVSVMSSPEVFTEPMALSLDYWEQTGNALNNLLNLQCWASTVNITKVLEPSILSFRSPSPYQFSLNETMAFEDLFDISRWNMMSIKRGYSILVSLNNFVAHASKKVLYVHIKYIWSYTSCASIPKKLEDYLLKNGFRVVKSVCIEFLHSRKIMSEAEFEGLVFKGVSRDMTVIFNEWRGIRDTKRVALEGRKCKECLSSMTNVTLSYHQPSEITYVPYNSASPVIVSQNISSHIHQFVSEHLSGEKYIAIMLRTEKTQNSKMSGSLEKNSCASGILSDWKSIAEHNNITKTLLFSDIGKHGSTGWEDPGTARRFAKYIEDAVRVNITPDKMNSILEQTTGSVNSVQIALMHQQLVAHATCVVMVGGGAFQAHTLNQYAHLHRGHECYSVKLGECESHSYMTRIHGQEL